MSGQHWLRRFLTPADVLAKTERQVEQRIHDLAAGLGVDPDRLLDSRKFCARVDDLPVTGWDDFDRHVTALIREEWMP